MNELVQQDWILRIQKRDGRVETFEPQKIIAAIQKAGEATGEFAAEEARRLALQHVLTSIVAIGATNVNRCLRFHALRVL